MSLVAEPKEMEVKTQFTWRQCQFTKDQINFHCYKTASFLCDDAFCIIHCKGVHTRGH